MLIIRHRVNHIKDLKSVPPQEGVEVDIYEKQGKLRLTHDPFEAGEPFEDYLKQFRHALLILNMKSDGLEAKALELVKKYSVKNYFFLDLANPTLIRLSRNGTSDLAVRFSEFEPIESCLVFAGKANWVWVDCFTKLPLNESNYKILKKHFKICLVSPELQKHPKSKIQEFRKQLGGMNIDAVCTDFPGEWAA